MSDQEVPPNRRMSDQEVSPNRRMSDHGAFVRPAG